jgi:uncharacterized membrane protein
MKVKVENSIRAKSRRLWTACAAEKLIVDTRASESTYADAVLRSRRTFHLLKTWTIPSRQNGILFYLAVDDRKFSVLGDTGIHAHVRMP